jgi:hypothetical protein
MRFLAVQPGQSHLESRQAIVRRKPDRPLTLLSSLPEAYGQESVASRHG